MEALCKKSLTGIRDGQLFQFVKGKTYPIVQDEEGYNYIDMRGYKFVFSSYNRKFLRYFDIIDSELEELLSRLKED